MALFLDANALVKRHIAEKGSVVVQTILARPEFRGALFVAQHIEPEVMSALAKKVREGRLAEDGFRVAAREFYRNYPDIFNVVPLTPGLFNEAASLIWMHPRRQLSASDALHLSAARHVARTILAPHDPLTVVTSDRQVANGAHAFNLETFDPETASIEDLPAP